MATNTVLGKLKAIANRHPIVRGMVSYGILWPTSCAIQDLIAGSKIGGINWKRCIRFSVYGSLVVAPMFYGWMRLTSAMWPETSLKVGLVKGIVEQFSFTPFALSCFFVGMNILEFKGIKEGFDEVTKKLLPTMKVAVCFWPVAQTINFSMVPEQNRVVFVSMVSFTWTIFLAYMKKLDKDKMSENSPMNIRQQ